MTNTHATATLVTGGRGLIGGAIVDAIRQFCPTLSAGRGAGCDLTLDLARQRPDFSRVAGGCWVHAAGVTDEECAATPDAAITRAALATPAMIDDAVTAGVEKFVYVSSAHVYGPLEGHIDEATPTNPLSLYAQCHFLAEQAFRLCAMRHGKPVLILRPCAVYGMPPALDTFRRWNLIPFEFPRHAVERQRIAIRSSGLQTRNFVSNRWIAKLVAAFLQQHTENTLRIVNPIGADDISVREFALRCARRYQQLNGRQCEVSWHDASATSKALAYRSIHPDCTAPESELDQYLDEILMRLEQHAYQE